MVELGYVIRPQSQIAKSQCFEVVVEIRPTVVFNAQKMKFPIMKFQNFYRNRGKIWMTWSHLREKHLMENLIFCEWFIFSQDLKIKAKMLSMKSFFRVTPAQRFTLGFPWKSITEQGLTQPFLSPHQNFYERNIRVQNFFNHSSQLSSFTGLFLYPLKTSENQMFSDVFRGCRKRPVAWNGSMKASKKSS